MMRIRLCLFKAEVWAIPAVLIRYSLSGIPYPAFLIKSHYEKKPIATLQRLPSEL
ncbi:hypothetical protein H3U94_09070 [Bartonella sp. W8125]|uniref:hypothetical protein n=1 Tax=Bartonella TaxID=773 RepID=UPI0018DD71F0|nr:hypothetical protein [Bartonella choladocola]MBI0141022.1 hypothetical protein [Bartonella choladocola]